MAFRRRIGFSDRHRDSLLDRLDQIHSFALNLPSEHHPIGASFLSHALPIATAISVLTIADGWGSVPVSPGPLIEDLFESNAPRLQYMAFERFGLSWNLDKFPRLTSLFLDKCYFVNPMPEGRLLNNARRATCITPIVTFGCPGPMLAWPSAVRRASY